MEKFALSQLRHTAYRPSLHYSSLASEQVPLVTMTFCRSFHLEAALRCDQQPQVLCIGRHLLPVFYSTTVHLPLQPVYLVTISHERPSLAEAHTVLQDDLGERVPVCTGAAPP